MIYRIDYQHFLTHMIDHFTFDEILSIQYCLISVKVSNTSKLLTVNKCGHFFPTTDMILCYEETKNKEILEEMYMDLLLPKDNKLKKQSGANSLYTTFINPLLHHVDICIVCDEVENDYIDCFCNILQKEYAIEVINLNELFKKGFIHPITINREKIWDKAVDIRKLAGNRQIDELKATYDGRMRLLNVIMDKKSKLHALKELGIDVDKNTKEKELNQLLIEAWELEIEQ